MWTIDQLKTFKLAAEMQNFAQVADKLGVSATAVGKQIKSLEEALEAQLFYRTTRHVALTEVGETFYAQAKLILNQIRNTNEMIATHRGIVAGKLKIICPVFVGENKILPLIPEFMQRYPEVKLDIEMADRVPDLEAENIDLSIGLVGVLPEPYVRRKILSDYNVFCASPKYIKQYGMPKVPADLTNHRFIAHKQRPHPTVVMVGKNRVTIKPVIWASSTNIMVSCVLNGVGIAELHSDTVKPFLKNKTLIEVFSEYRESPQPIYIHFKKAQYMQSTLRAFIDFLLERLVS